jgi:hypothetical protein
MFRLISAFVIAALFTAFAVDRPANGEDTNVVALNTDRTVTTTGPALRAPSPNDYAGVYQTADGATFVVVRDGESLAIELPETVALPMRAAGTGFVLDASFVRISFENDAGNVRLVLARALEEPVVATRMPTRQGVVTVHDI